MYKLLQTIDMRGTTKEILKTDDMNDINEVIKNKKGFYYVEEENGSYMTVQSFGRERYEVLSLGSI